jgi:hypothetical protein
MALQFIVSVTTVHTITVDVDTLENGNHLVDRLLDGEAYTRYGRVLEHQMTWPERDVKRVNIINTA